MIYKRLYIKHPVFLTFILLLSLSSASCFKANGVGLKEEVDNFSIKVEKPEIEIYKIINNKLHSKVEFTFNTLRYPDAVLTDAKMGLFGCKSSEYNDSFAYECAKKISFNDVSGEKVYWYNSTAPDGIVKGWFQPMDIFANEEYNFWSFVNHNNHTFYSKDFLMFKYELSSELQSLINANFAVDISKVEVINHPDNGNQFRFSLEGQHRGSVPNVVSCDNFFVFIKKGITNCNVSDIKDEWYDEAKKRF